MRFTLSVIHKVVDRTRSPVQPIKGIDKEAPKSAIRIAGVHQTRVGKNDYLISDTVIVRIKFNIPLVEGRIGHQVPAGDDHLKFTVARSGPVREDVAGINPNVLDISAVADSPATVASESATALISRTSVSMHKTFP